MNTDYQCKHRGIELDVTLYHLHDPIPNNSMANRTAPTCRGLAFKFCSVHITFGDVVNQRCVLVNGHWRCHVRTSFLDDNALTNMYDGKKYSIQIASLRARQYMLTEFQCRYGEIKHDPIHTTQAPMVQC